jgi:hypothetical protein
MSVDAPIVRELEDSARYLGVLRMIAFIIGAILFLPGLALLFTKEAEGRTGLKLLFVLGGALYITTGLMIHRYRAAIGRVIEQPTRPQLAASMFEHSVSI